MKGFNKTPLLGILRGIRSEQLKPLLAASLSAGLTALEITLNTEGAEQLISQLRDEAGGRLSVGAGTVLNAKDLQRALSAGAEFIVTPVFVPEVSSICREKGIPLFPGALTPKEVFEAWQAGAEMIKLFPAGCFGPAYFRELAGPFADIKLLACGGVNESNISEFFACGAAGAAFGGSIFRADWLEAGDYDKVGEAITTLIQAAGLAQGA